MDATDYKRDTAPQLSLSLVCLYGIAERVAPHCHRGTTRRLRRSLGVVLTSLALFSAADVLAAPVSISVTQDQRVTVIGRSASLKTILEDICYRASVELEFYDAADRPFGGTFRDVPLRKLLWRLLSRESFMAGAATIDDGRETVVWLRVFGDPAVAAARRAAGAGNSSESLRVPPLLLHTAFGKDTDPEAKQSALGILAQRIAGSREQLQAWLATDSALIAEALRSYGNAAPALHDLASKYPDPRIQQKIAEILAALERPALIPVTTGASD